MDSMVCPSCNLSIEPIRVFEKSKNSAQWWRITKCPRDRCSFNIDLEKCDSPGRNSKSKDGDKGRAIWRYGVE